MSVPHSQSPASQILQSISTVQLNIIHSQTQLTQQLYPSNITVSVPQKEKVFKKLILILSSSIFFYVLEYMVCIVVLVVYKV